MSSALTPHAIKSTADRFVAARKSGQAIADYPGPFPESLSDGYEIQKAAIKKMGSPVLGWKVAAVEPEFVDEFGASRIVGPVFCISSRGPDVSVQLFSGGYAAAEAEIQLRIGGLPPSGAALRLEDVIQRIDRICFGIEVAGSPFPDINQHGPAVTVSDFGNNNGLVIGPAIAREDVTVSTGCAIRCRLNDRTLGVAVLTSLDFAFTAAKSLFELAEEYELPLRSGQWISTGALTGAHQVRAGDRFVADFSTRGSVSCHFG